MFNRNLSRAACRAGSTSRQQRTRGLLPATLILFPLLWQSAAVAQSAPPRIFYSDLQSGPKAGGENNNGAYVTVYGARFGASQGSSYVTVGGGKAVNYKVWTDSKVSFQLGASAASGNIAITTSAGTSNTVPFTVRSGNVYFVSNGGNDNNNGSFSSPWQTIVKAKGTIAAGDIAYVMNGVAQTSIDDYNADVAIETGGSTSAPMALVAYPGATVKIGTPSVTYGLRTPAISGSKNNWVIAGMTIVATQAIDLVGVTGWRLVNNDLSCPYGSGEAACLQTESTSNVQVYGNYVHNVGDAAGSITKYYHGIYYTTNSNHIDMGWNTVVPNPSRSTKSGGCRAVQFHSTSGADQYDLHVHDNVIHDAICDGINFATVNPNNGVVEAYNNIIYHVGTGPDPADGSSNYACITMGSSVSPTTQARVYNNTLYDCGTRGTSDSGALAIGIPTVIQNNIVQAVGSESYFEPSWSTSCSLITGSNNLWYGAAGSLTSCTSSNKSVNPLLINLSGANFQLQSGSPAIDAGLTISSLQTDIVGIHRPQGSAYDIGAYEYFKGSGTGGGGGGTGGNSCDLNADGVVNSLDVQIAVNQAVGTAACGSADLQQNGSCTVVDVQRVVNASLGQSCRTGP